MSKGFVQGFNRLERQRNVFRNDLEDLENKEQYLIEKMKMCSEGKKEYIKLEQLIKNIKDKKEIINNYLERIKNEVIYNEVSNFDAVYMDISNLRPLEYYYNIKKMDENEKILEMRVLFEDGYSYPIATYYSPLWAHFDSVPKFPIDLTNGYIESIEKELTKTQLKKLDKIRKENGASIYTVDYAIINGMSTTKKVKAKKLYHK